MRGVWSDSDEAAGNEEKKEKKEKADDEDDDYDNEEEEEVEVEVLFFLYGKYAGLMIRDVQGPTRFFFFFTGRARRDSVGKFTSRLQMSANFCNSRSRLPMCQCKRRSAASSASFSREVPSQSSSFGSAPNSSNTATAAAKYSGLFPQLAIAHHDGPKRPAALCG
jgi:hypothetical protein